MTSVIGMFGSNVKQLVHVPFLLLIAYQEGLQSLISLERDMPLDPFRLDYILLFFGGVDVIMKAISVICYISC